jgi:CubicO group peptidase (beta-lactamase class C family)
MTRIKKTFSSFSIIVLLLILPFVLHAKKTVDYPALDRYIKKAAADFHLEGLTIGIVKDDRVVFIKGYGVKDVDSGEKVTPDSLFNIASLTKAFTAACVGILVQQGKLHWDDKVIDLLPGFQLSDPYISRELTIRDILSHRSGFGTFDGDLLWYRTPYDPAEIIRRMRYMPVRQQFRSEFGYQNNMYIIAGEIVGRVSGMPWAEFLKTNLLDPLEMKTTLTCSQSLREGMNLARPHVEGETYPLYVQAPNAAASIYSSAAEMLNWLRMLLNDGKWKDKQLLQPAVLEELFSPRTILKVSSFFKKNGTHFRTYGLGWNISDYYGELFYEHSGGMPGYISKAVLVPGKKLGFVILTNNLNGATNLLKYKLLDLFVTGRQTDWNKVFMEFVEKGEKRKKEEEEARLKSRVANTRPSLEPGRYAGIYEDRVYGRAQIVFENETLVLSLLPAKEVFTSDMEHWHYDTFRVKFRDSFLPQGFVTFQFDSNGEVIGFKIDLPNPDFHFHHLDFKKVSSD